MAENYQITRYSPKYRDLVLRLQARLWGPDLQANSRYFRWKYESNPYDPGPRVYLCLLGDDVVGMRGFWETRWKVADRCIPAICAGDLVVLPEHESRGIFRRLMESAEADFRAAGYELLLNFSASPVTFLHSIRAGWQAVQPRQTLQAASPAWKAIRRMDYLLETVPGLWRIPYRDAIYSMPHRVCGIFTPMRTAAVSVSRRPRLQEMAELSLRQSQDTCISQVADEEYLAWRFRNPFSDYRFFYQDDDGLQGFLVLQRRFAKHRGEWHIVDWRAATPGASASLIHAAMAYSRPGSVSIWTGSRSGAERNLLADAGFEAVDDSRGIRHYQPSLLVKILGSPGDVTALAGRGAWNVHMLSSDEY